MDFAFHSPGHVDCPGCRAQSLLHAEVNLAEMLFPEAFDAWLKARVVDHGKQHQVRYLSDESVRTYSEMARALGHFFQQLPLREVHDGHLRSYQALRAAGGAPWKRKAGQNRIRKEIGLMLRILRAAGVWTDDLSEAFDQLPVALTDVRRVLEPDEQRHFLAILRTRAEWFWLHDYTVLALQTCASTKEIRSIRLRDINYRNRTLRIGIAASKNKFRNRTIPLSTEEVVQALRSLERRARGMGSKDPAHCMFPFGSQSRNGRLDITRPMTKCAIKLQWAEARRVAGLPWLRPYDLRHTAITRMAEAGVPIATIMSFAGHISIKMQQHYTTISMEAKRKAAAQVWAADKAVDGAGKDVTARKPVRRAEPTPISDGRKSADNRNRLCG